MVDVEEERRVSWGAVFAGALVVITSQIAFTLLGLAIGFGIIDPGGEGGSLSALGTGTALWWLITGLVSLFLGGWVAGRLAAVPRGLDASLHGLVTWSLATLLTVVLIGSGASVVVGGLLSVVGQAADAVQQGISGVDIDGTAEVDRDEMDRAMERIVQEARGILQATDVPELQPEELEERARQARGTLEERLRAAARDPQQADEELRQAFQQVWGEAQEVASAADREALVNALVAETDLSREEAESTVEEWSQTVEEARQRARDLGQELVAKAQERAGAAADALARVAFWGFLVLLLGVAAAMTGGFLGARRP